MANKELIAAVTAALEALRVVRSTAVAAGIPGLSERLRGAIAETLRDDQGHTNNSNAMWRIHDAVMMIPHKRKGK